MKRFWKSAEVVEGDSYGIALDGRHLPFHVAILGKLLRRQSQITLHGSLQRGRNRPVLHRHGRGGNEKRRGSERQGAHQTKVPATTDRQ